jgi:hypothetical protein
MRTLLSYGESENSPNEHHPDRWDEFVTNFDVEVEIEAEIMVME